MVGELADARRHGNKKEGKEKRSAMADDDERKDCRRHAHSRDSAVDADVQVRNSYRLFGFRSLLVKEC